MTNFKNLKCNLSSQIAAQTYASGKLASNHFLLPCFSGEEKTVASVRGGCEISTANNFPTWGQ